ncbi:hypothetical protein ACFOWA_17310 [Pedobacter lithocola]|uniref:DKNYY family protein n=1 Tax=Pedobacter lithocola TaxID=1908239 RepID=A0ABV8PG32_9SPHI
MRKKIIIGILLFLGLFCGICFYWGYTIPQKDKHKDWIFFPEDKDTEFAIEKTGICIDPFQLHFPSLKGSIILNQDEDKYYSTTIVDEHYRTVKILPKAKSFYIDSANHRIILDESSLDNDSTSQLFGYDLKNFEKSGPLIINKHPIKETFREFVNRKNYTYVPADSKRDEQWTAEYIAGKPKETNFYKKLSAVTELSNMYDELNVHCYTDNNGQLFDIEDAESFTDRIHDIWESLYLLFPNYDKETTGLLPRDYIRFIESDKPSVYSNFLYVGVFFSPIEFRQWNINYYSIKFGNKSFNFKDMEDDDNYFEQLNTPKNEKDTLFMFGSQSVYQVYLKSNRKQKLKL